MPSKLFLGKDLISILVVVMFHFGKDYHRWSKDLHIELFYQLGSRSFICS